MKKKITESQIKLAINKILSEDLTNSKRIMVESFEDDQKCCGKKTSEFGPKERWCERCHSTWNKIGNSWKRTTVKWQKG